MQAPRIGYCVPSFSNLDPLAAVEAAVEAEHLGFDSVWVADHLMHGHEGAIMDGWTTLAAIAGRHLASPSCESGHGSASGR